MMALGVIGIVYGALLAMAQTDVKRLIACSSVSHLGYVVLGLFALTAAGLARQHAADGQPRPLDGPASSSWSA